jgi:predicted CopG family antitoxin
MIERVRQRARSKSISISLELWEKIEKVCDHKISVSSFIKMAVKKELMGRGIC